MTGRRAADGGYILVAVLSVMLLLTGLVAAGSVLVRSTLHAAAIGDAALRMEGLTRGGLELTGYELFVRHLPPALVTERRIRLAGGTIVPHVVDEAGKIDLNGADPRVLTKLFTNAGVDAATTAGIVDAITARRGASPLPTVAPPSRHRRGWQAVDQLRDLPGVSRADFRILAPALTVYNPDGKVDIVTASRTVLEAIPGLARPTLETILSKRPGASGKAIEDLQAQLGPAIEYTKIKSGPAYTVRIDAVAGTGSKRSIEAVVAASKTPDDPYLLLDWRDEPS